MKKTKLVIGRKKHIGNAQNCGLDIPMFESNPKLRTISRKHACIHFDPDRGIFVLQNFGRNGTKVDGVLQKTFSILKPQAKIEIGKQILQFDEHKKT